MPHDTVIMFIQFDSSLLVPTKTDAAKASPMDYERPGQPEVRVDIIFSFASVKNVFIKCVRLVCVVLTGRSV